LFDSSTGIYSGINISTTAGLIRGPAHYGDNDPVGPGNEFVLEAVPNASTLAAGDPFLAMLWSMALTDAGGTVPIFTGQDGYAFETVITGNLPLGSVVSGDPKDIRYISGGAVTTVPEPGCSIMICALGLLGARAQQRK